MNRSTALLSAALTLAVSTGCYRYIPTQADAAPPGENVRIYVNRSVVESIGEIDPEFNQPVVRGRVMRREADGYFVRIPLAIRQEGFHSSELGQDVQVPFSDIIALERREFNRVGTGALVAGTAGAAAVVLFVIMEAFSGERDDPDCTDDCTELLTPGFSIPLRIGR